MFWPWRAIFWPILGKGDYGIHPDLWNLAWSMPGPIDYNSQKKQNVKKEPNVLTSTLIFQNKTRGLQLCPVFHFTTQWFSNPRCGQNMTTLLPKHGPHMVLQMGSSWILTNVPRDAPCQISLFCLNPVAPFPKNGENMACYGQNLVLTWSLKLVLPKSQSLCPEMFHAKVHIAGFIL